MVFLDSVVLGRRRVCYARGLFGGCGLLPWCRRGPSGVDTTDIFLGRNGQEKSVLTSPDVDSMQLAIFIEFVNIVIPLENHRIISGPTLGLFRASDFLR